MILANQVLYFLSPDDLGATVQMLWEKTRPGGVIIATMMGSQNYYRDFVTASEHGLEQVDLPNGKQLFITFTDNRGSLIERFAPYEPMHVGYYDSVVSEREGSGFHHLYVGRKA